MCSVGRSICPPPHSVSLISYHSPPMPTRTVFELISRRRTCLRQCLMNSAPSGSSAGSEPAEKCGLFLRPCLGRGAELEFDRFYFSCSLFEKAKTLKFLTAPGTSLFKIIKSGAKKSFIQEREKKIQRFHLRRETNVICEEENVIFIGVSWRKPIVLSPDLRHRISMFLFFFT